MRVPLIAASCACSIAWAGEATLAADAPAASPAAPTSSLTGCTAELLPPLVTFHCPDARVVSVFTAGGAAKEVMNGGMTMLQISTAVVDTVARPQGEPLMVFVATTAKGALDATSVARREGVADFLVCAPAGDGCKAVLLDLVDHGLPDLHPYLSSWVDPRPWPGQAMTVPVGCYPLPDDNGLPTFVCGMDTLSGWVILPGGKPKKTLEQTVKARAKAAKQNGTAMKQTAVKCHVGGVKGACVFSRRPPHTPFDAPNDVFGYAALADRSLVGMDCRWGGEATAIPAMCSQLLTLDQALPRR